MRLVNWYGASSLCAYVIQFGQDVKRSAFWEDWRTSLWHQFSDRLSYKRGIVTVVPPTISLGKGVGNQIKWPVIYITGYLKIGDKNE
jgi:hypothetical protein